MMSAGSDEVVANVTLPTSASSPAVNHISHFLSQNQAMGRYSIYTGPLPTGNSLLCSPALLGQPVSPWRSNLAISSLSGSTNTAAISTNTSVSTQQPLQQSSQQQQQQQALTGSASPYMNLTQLAQLPGLVCAPLGTFLQNPPPGNAAQSDSSNKKGTSQEAGSLKRRSDSSHAESESHKRARLTDPPPQSPGLVSSTSSSTSSSSSSSASSPHPNAPLSAFQSKSHSQQRSPVIKVIPYTPSQGAPLMIHTSPSSSLAQTIVFPSVNLSMGTSPGGQQQPSLSVSTSTSSSAGSGMVTSAATAVPTHHQQKVVNLQHLQPHLQSQQQQQQAQHHHHHKSSSSSSSPSPSLNAVEQFQAVKGNTVAGSGNGGTILLGKHPNMAPSDSNSTVGSNAILGATATATALSSSHLPHPHQYLLLQQQPQQLHHSTVGGSNNTSNNQLVLPHSTRHLLSSLRLVLLKCLGPVSECVVSQNHLILSSFLQDLYRQSYFTTSNFSSEPPLSPESCCLLTICYLSSLQRGEQISVEGLRAMIHHAQLGELEWLNYYKKHKKMSESSFVQAQLIHLSRVAVYPVQGKVRVVISNQSLNEGVVMALQKLAQLWTSSEQNFPEYWVVLAVRPSSTIDFCVIVTDPLQVQLLMELKTMNADSRSSKKQQQQIQVSRSLSGAGNSAVQLSSSLAISSSSLHASNLNITISKELLLAIQSFQERLNGGVLIPFYRQDSMRNRNREDLLMGMGLVRMECEEAASFSPTSSHLVEHRAKGPFQDQYNVAMHLLQKILSYWGSQAKIDEYQRVDFRVLCPSEASFVSQTMMDIMEAGLVEHLRIGGSSGKKSGRKSGSTDGKISPTSGSATATTDNKGASLLSEVAGVSKDVKNRVICCGPSGDSPQFRGLLKEIEANATTLFIVVAENGHLTNQLSSKSPSLSGPFTDDSHLLCQLSNCILVNVSSFPYSLQTNRSFVSFSNEIHWPTSVDKSSSHFCSSADFRSNQFQNLENEFEYGVRFREDQCFEEMFHEYITNQAASGCHHRSVVAIRLQLLLNQYTSALLGTIGKSSTACPSSPADSASPKTQDIINKLVLGPLSSPRGHGCMVVVRAHDPAIGKVFYQKIRQIRDALGLSYRFEVIYDDGSTFLKISEHFSRRLAQWRCGRHVNGVSSSRPGGGRLGCRVTSYKELENLPCLVVLAGEHRAGLSFPSSLRLVDLRLCYVVGTITRLHYEYDTSFFNGYYKVQIKPTSPSPLSPEQQDMDTKSREPAVSGSESTDADVFDSTSVGIHSVTLPTSTIPTSRTGSTSSSRKSSYEESSHDGKAGSSHRLPPPLLAVSGETPNRSPSNGFNRPNVVEWRPEESNSDVEVSLPSTPRDEAESRSEMREAEPLVKEEEDEEAESMVGVAHSTSPKDGDSSVGYMSDVYSSTVTVTIDPPRDSGHEGNEDDPVYRYLEGGGASIGSRPAGVVSPDENAVPEEDDEVGDRGEGFGQGEEFEDKNGGGCGVWQRFCGGDGEEEEEEGGGGLYDSLNDMDLSEEEDNDTSPPIKLCLLSRQYYYIWCCRSAHQHLLLQPSPGVSWHGGQKRPPLFDQDPRQQSAHYRKWTKPSHKDVRNKYDGLMKMANKSSRRRFLLSGPPQVGKTGAWILMIKLLHDHLRSSLGVAVENRPLPASLFTSPHSLHKEKVPALPCLENGLSEADKNSALGTISPSTSVFSRIVPLDYLHHIYRKCDDDGKDSKPMKPHILQRDTPTRSQSESSRHEMTTSGLVGGHSRRHEVVSIPVSPYVAYDSGHSCNECSKYVRGTPSSPAEYLTSFLPSSGGAAGGGGGGLTIKWRIPAGQQKHCVVNISSKTLERLELPVVRLRGGDKLEKPSSQVMTLVFTPTLGRDSSGLFNLFHGQFYGLHVLVTSEAEFVGYCKAWPNHIIMALPSKATVGLGSMYHCIKEFCQHNLLLNNLANQLESSSRVVWPYVAIISDSVVMVKKMDSESRSYVDISLSAALQSFEQSSECLHYAALGALPWNRDLEQEGQMLLDGSDMESPITNHRLSLSSTAGSEVSHLTDYDLSHDFILLNLSKLAGTHYNQYSFNSAMVDFNLQLKACQCQTKLCTDLVFIKKHLKSGGNPYPLHLDVSDLCQDVDKLVISLHHDSSSHLPHPGPYLMEHYLLYKSQVLFPYAHSPQFPVLAIDNYISLGPHTHVSYIKSEMLLKAGGSGNGSNVSSRHAIEQNGSLDMSPSNSFGNRVPSPFPVEDLRRIKFGGLLLYLCEEKLLADQLKGLNFVSGASLCLVTRDCKTLVKEVTRLDLEEKWKFRLRDEYQTACADDMTPLFFFIGRFEG